MQSKRRPRAFSFTAKCHSWPVYVYLCLCGKEPAMDCWKTHYVTKSGSQASASRVFINSQERACTSGRVESTASSASVYCTLDQTQQVEDPDLLMRDEHDVTISSSDDDQSGGGYSSAKSPTSRSLKIINSGGGGTSSTKSPTSCSLKIINPNNTGGEEIIKDLEMQRYTSVEDLKTQLCEQFSEYTEGYETQFGYVIPGHGMKGKQEKISTDEQLAVMYESHKKRKRILLWLKCIPNSKKRASSESDAPQSKRHASLVTMMNEVDTLAGKLKEKHGEKYTPVQLNCWAHMINTHKHESLDSPPKKSFFGKKRSGDPPGVSPGKRITLRSECIDQLDKWHKLKERGVIGNDEYEELQKAILTDIKRF